MKKCRKWEKITFLVESQKRPIVRPKSLNCVHTAHYVHTTIY